MKSNFCSVRRQADRECFRSVTFEMVWTVNISNIIYLADKDGNLIYTADRKLICLRKARKGDSESDSSTTGA